MFVDSDSILFHEGGLSLGLVVGHVGWPYIREIGNVSKRKTTSTHTLKNLYLRVKDIL